MGYSQAGRGGWAMNINSLLNERSPPSTYIYGLGAEIRVHASIYIYMVFAFKGLIMSVHFCMHT